MTYNEGQRPTWATTEIEEMARARELEQGNIFLELVSGHARMLADIFSVGFAPELLPQGRIKLIIKFVIAPTIGFYMNGHLHLVNPLPKHEYVQPSSRARLRTFE